MEFTNFELNDFGSRLTSLGGRLGYDSYPSNKYIDIEEFFLDATRFVFADERLARCIENWIRTYGFLIGPSKIKKLIEKEKHSYDPAVLGVFLKLIEGTKEKQLNLDSLSRFCSKKEGLTYRSPSKVKVRPNDFDENWIEFNIATQKFVDESQKNLLNFDYTLKNSPEIRNRIETDDILCSDYKAYIQREGKDHSLNSICKRIHSHYSNLHKIYTRFEKFGINQNLHSQSLQKSA
jgi:hypothetical protein